MSKAQSKKAGEVSQEDAPKFYLSETQQEDLKQFWYAVGEMAEVLPMPGHSSGRCEALRIIADSVGNVFQELNGQMIPAAVAKQLLEAKK